MNKTTQEWKEILKNLNMDLWNIGTNVLIYLENSLFKWFHLIDWNSNWNIYLKKKMWLNEYKILFEKDENITFYEAKNKQYYSYSTARQCLDTLLAFEIIEKIDESKFQIHNTFREFVVNENKHNNVEKIFILFLKRKLNYFLNKYILVPLENYKYNHSFNENDKNKNQSTKFWWNVLLAYDKIAEYSKLTSNNIFLSSEFFYDLSKIIFENKLDLKEFYNNFFEKTTREFQKNNIILEEKNLENTKDWIALDISSIFNTIAKEENPKCNCDNTLIKQINHTSLDHKTKEASKVDKFKSFAITIPELFELSSRLELPIFQRTYSWDENIIGHLFESIYNDFNIGPNEFTFLNTIIISNSGENILILDGQQRTVSNTLLAIAFARWAKYIDDKQTLQKIADKIFTKNNNIKKTIQTWLNTDPHYQNLNFIFSGNFSLGKKKSNFYKNYYEICEIIEKKFTNKNDKFSKFIDYFLEKVHFVVAYVGNVSDNSTKMTRIFQNLNQYSKPLGILDLFRNKIYEHYKNKNKNADNYVRIYEETINLFFRKDYKTDSEEEVKNINVFVDTVLIKNEQFKILKEVDEEYNSLSSKCFQKLCRIFDNYEDENKNPLLELFKDLIDFQYCWEGNISKFKISHLDNEDKDNKEKFNFFYNKLSDLLSKNPEASEFIQQITTYSSKIASYDFVGSQIMHISKKTKRTVFIPLISLFKKRSKINFLDNKDDRDLDWKVSNFSKHLFPIEKFSILWTLYTKGQSLTESINKICENLSEGNIAEEGVFKKLKQTISLDLNKTDQEWSKEIYSTLSTQFNSDFNPEEENIKSSKSRNNDLWLIWIRLIYGMNDVESPQYFSQNASRLDKLNSTYEHCIPVKLNKEIKKQYSSKELKELEQLVYNIGNGGLISGKENSKQGNSFNKEYSNFSEPTVYGGGMSRKLKISIEDPQYNLKGKILEILPNPNKLLSLKNNTIQIDNEKYSNNFESLKKYIKKRAAQVLSGYVSIFFSSDNK